MIFLKAKKTNLNNKKVSKEATDFRIGETKTLKEYIKNNIHSILRKCVLLEYENMDDFEGKSLDEIKSKE